MLQKPARLQYVLLALVAVLGLTHIVVSNMLSFRSLANGTQEPALPFYNGTMGRPVNPSPAQLSTAGLPPGFSPITLTYIEKPSLAAGLQQGDAVYTIDGHPYTGTAVLEAELKMRRPGQALTVTFWNHRDPLAVQPARATIILARKRTAPPPLWAWFLQSFFTLVPAFCLLTGLFVVFARPRNPYTWLVLGVLGYVSALLLGENPDLPALVPVSIVWRNLGQTAMPISFMLFGLFFPTRAHVDKLFPWFKWVLLVPTLVLLPLDFLGDFGLHYRFGLVSPFVRWITPISIFENLLATSQITLGFSGLYSNVANPSTAPDARRRLRILIAGCTLGLTPLLALLATSTYQGTDLGGGVPKWVALTVFTLLIVFPVTLAYVVIVQRAMDLRILIRQGTKYFFARQSIFVIGFLLATLMSYKLSLFFSSQAHRRPVDFIRIFGIIATFFVFRTIGARKMQRRIDQKFFREAYSTEQILSELSDEARNFTEVDPLLQTITRRLGTTLHIDRIAVFLRAGDTFQLQFATGLPSLPGYIPALAASSTTIVHLARGNAAPATVYRDDPSSWLVEATDTERAALADLSTELLVPLPGRNRLVGVIALGPKRSEEPYSKADRQLLQSVASQTGLALENAELLANLTAQLEQRARIDREIEIAREVQERLFPQTYPHLPGVGLCGFCRPAQFVGGDYYDFFLIPATASAGQRLAIAIGDISGKGISAALLMASLRASLRSVATLQQAGGTAHLATLMSHVNRLVYEASTSNRYATFFYAELDPATLVLEYVNAGHNCPAILRHSGESSEAIRLEPTGTVIGLLPGAAYEQASMQLHAGDTLLAFTDGISEAMTGDDEEWGEDRMVAAAQALVAESGCNHTAQHLLECLLAQADAFTAGAPQHDDMTLLVATLS